MSLADVDVDDTRTSVLDVRGLSKSFAVRGRGVRGKAVVRALTDVSIAVDADRTLGVVGESGCGKSTLARILAGLETPSSGTGRVADLDAFSFRRTQRLERARRLQMVFQDPYTSLDPRMTIFELLSEPWAVHRGFLPRQRWQERAAEVLELVGLDPAIMTSTVRSLSGGQRQRVGLARALALEPQILVLDEPVSALDVSVQAQIVELLRDLQQRTGMAMIFIAHDLAVVRSLATDIAVMYLGRVVEQGPTQEVYDDPQHPYTQALLSAAPSFHKPARDREVLLTGEIPSPRAIPTGCPFRTRCWRARDICATERPPLQARGHHPVACHFPGSDEPTTTTETRTDTAARPPLSEGDT